MIKLRRVSPRHFHLLFGGAESAVGRVVGISFGAGEVIPFGPAPSPFRVAELTGQRLERPGIAGKLTTTVIRPFVQGDIELTYATPTIAPTAGWALFAGANLIDWFAVGHVVPTPSAHHNFSIVFDKPGYRAHEAIRFRINGLSPPSPRVGVNALLSFDGGCSNLRYARLVALRDGVSMRWKDDNFTIYPDMRGHLGPGSHTFCVYWGNRTLATATFTLLA